MFKEIETCVSVVGKFLSGSDADVKSFSESLNKSLTQKFTNHWFEDAPHRGSGYRSLSFTKGKPDRIILDVMVKHNLKPKASAAKDDVCIFCDPGFVAHKVGNGPMIVAYSCEPASTSTSGAHKRTASNDLSLSSSSRNSSLSLSLSLSSSSPPMRLESLEDRLARRAASSSPPSPTRGDELVSAASAFAANGSSSLSSSSSSVAPPARSNSPPIAPLSANSVDAPTFVFAENVRIHRASPSSPSPSPSSSRFVVPSPNFSSSSFIATPNNNLLSDHQLQQQQSIAQKA